MEMLKLLSTKLREGSPVLMSTTGKLKHGGIGALQIAVISAIQLSKEGVFFFSTQDLVFDRMLSLSWNHPLCSRLSLKEWFAMDWIPQEAVGRIIPI
jgi:hypothetical protein